MPSTIVVGYDGHDHAKDALALGRLLARAGGVRLVVACAYPEDPLGESASAHAITQGVREDALSTLERARAEETAGDGDAESGQIPVEYRAIAGAAPARVLHELAEEVDAALIVVGATHHGAAVRLLTGSTPERVLEGAHCPIAVAPEGFAAAHASEPRAIARIAVAFDESPESDHALDAAAALAGRVGARLRVVTVVNTTVGLYPPLDATAYAEISDIARSAAQERLDAAVARLAGVVVETVVLEGDPVIALIEDSPGDDLMFAGSRGHGPFRRVLLGSVSTKLLRDAACPVVIVPRGSGEGDGETAAGDGDAAAAGAGGGAS